MPHGVKRVSREPDTGPLTAQEKSLGRTPAPSDLTAEARDKAKRVVVDRINNHKGIGDKDRVWLLMVEQAVLDGNIDVIQAAGKGLGKNGKHVDTLVPLMKTHMQGAGLDFKSASTKAGEPVFEVHGEHLTVTFDSRNEKATAETAKEAAIKKASWTGIPGASGLFRNVPLSIAEKGDANARMKCLGYLAARNLSK